MTVYHAELVKGISKNFQIDGQLIEAIPYGSGHINDTYLGRYRCAHGEKRFIHQWINHHVFKEPEKVMENIERVTRYARQQISANGGNPDRQSLTLIPARDGRSFFRTEQGDYWRTYVFIDGARSYDIAEDLRHVYNSSRAFGDFQKLLSNLPGERLHETIPNFHHTRKRFEAFLQAVKADPKKRAGSVKPEIEFILRREADASRVIDLLEKGVIPERVTHNDTKLNNVLIDDISGAAVCVIDLDTMMPGTVLYDFGDMVRMGAATAAEDEPDLSRVGINLTLFDRLAQGYLDAASDFLTPAELDHLAFAGKLITFEQAIRFLGDYLNGDVYYKIHRPEHNLERARTQLKMVMQMEEKMEEMQAIVAKYSRNLLENNFSKQDRFFPST